MIRVSPQWLRLREPADAAARSADLVDCLRKRLPDRRPLVIHDLACGTGSMCRWLAPQLTGPQRWVLHDLDADLLAHAATAAPDVTIETRHDDVTRLAPAELSDADLITASAVLDIMTATEIDRLVASSAPARCPVLITLSVAGRVEFCPADPLDDDLAAAFNAHQRRTTGEDRRLLGPDAVGAAVDAFARRGIEPLVRPSLWRLGTADAALTAEWLTGWVAAACEQRPELAEPAAAYSRRRLAEAAAGRLTVAVHHNDLLAIPG